MRRIQLRPARPDKAPSLLEVYASTRADELELLPWIQFAFRERQYRAEYPEAVTEIILFRGPLEMPCPFAGGETRS